MEQLVVTPNFSHKNVLLYKLIKFSDFGTYFRDFRSTFHSDRGLFSPNVESKVYF